MLVYSVLRRSIKVSTYCSPFLLKRSSTWSHIAVGACSRLLIRREVKWSEAFADADVAVVAAFPFNVLTSRGYKSLYDGIRVPSM